VHALSESEVWAAGLGGTVVKTSNAGETWSAYSVPGASELEFRDIHAFENGIVYLLAAGPGEKSRIYKSSDGGHSWRLQFQNSITNAFFDCMGFWDPNSGIAFSDSVDGYLIIIRTIDGQNWEVLPRTQIPPALPGEGSFAASGTCLAAGDNQQAWIGTGAASSARVFHSRDKGESWTVAETPIQPGKTSGITSISFFDANEGFVFGGDVVDTGRKGNNIAMTTDGGLTWNIAESSELPAIYGAAAFYFEGRRMLAAVGPKGTFFSSDQGKTWKTVNQDNYWGISFTNRGVGWIVGPEGKVSRIIVEAAED